MSAVLVTGGAGGMARAILARLLADGRSVALADRDAAALAALHAGLPDAERARVTVHELDVTRDDDAMRVVAEAVAAHGGLDALVNNAGIMVRHDAHATGTAEFSRILDVNLTGAFRMAKAAHAALLASGGAIVSVSSTHAFLAAKNSVAYSTSKAGISHLTRLLALEWAADGIRVNAVAPTVTPTPMTDDVLADPAYVARKMAAIPLGRPIAPEHVAGAIAYLLSPDAGSTTGQVLVLDGGESLA
jgi:NAD(P)-dependent dehydrogenase (short-subunit alcohol dehydrogenase family)